MARIFGDGWSRDWADRGDRGGSDVVQQLHAACRTASSVRPASATRCFTPAPRPKRSWPRSPPTIGSGWRSRRRHQVPRRGGARITGTGRQARAGSAGVGHRRTRRRPGPPFGSVVDRVVPRASCRLRGRPGGALNRKEPAYKHPGGPTLSNAWHTRCRPTRTRGGQRRCRPTNNGVQQRSES